MPGFNEVKYTDSNRWYNKTIDARYEYVKKVLDFLVDGIEDREDLNFHLKEALVGGVYFSKSAMDMAVTFGLHNQFDIVKKIYEDGYYSIIEKDGSLNCKGLTLYSNFRKAWGKKLEDGIRKQKIKKDDEEWLSLSYEHVIPTSCYIDRLLELYKCGELDLETFKKMVSCINVCYILSIDKTIIEKKYRSDMPEDWHWGKDDPFARYERSGIAVWGRN